MDQPGRLSDALRLLIARFAVFPERVLAGHLKDHGRAPGYFTIVAATGVMGAEPHCFTISPTLPRYSGGPALYYGPPAPTRCLPCLP